MSNNYFVKNDDVYRLLIPDISEIRHRREREGFSLLDARRSIIWERLVSLLEGDQASKPPYPELTVEDLRKVLLFVVRESMWK